MPDLTMLHARPQKQWRSGKLHPICLKAGDISPPATSKLA